MPLDAEAPVGQLWGDARPANMVVENFGIVGLLDWELAGSGPGELDIVWFCEMNRMRSIGIGIAPLPGFLDDAATWRRWSAAVGRQARMLSGTTGLRRIGWRCCCFCSSPQRSDTVDYRPTIGCCERTLRRGDSTSCFSPLGRR